MGPRWASSTEQDLVAGEVCSLGDRGRINRDAGENGGWPGTALTPSPRDVTPWVLLLPPAWCCCHQATESHPTSPHSWPQSDNQSPVPASSPGVPLQSLRHSGPAECRKTR